VVTTVCYYQCTRAAGASAARHSLRPLISKGGMFSAKLARMARRDREAMSANSATNTRVVPRLDPGIHQPSQEHFWKRMDCRVEPAMME
jgi:hypothetical protein